MRPELTPHFSLYFLLLCGLAELFFFFFHPLFVLYHFGGFVEGSEWFVFLAELN